MPSTDPASSATPAANAWSAVSWIVPPSLTVIAVIDARSVINAEDALASSAANPAAVSFTVMLVGASGRFMIASTFAAVTPVTVRLSLEICARTSEMPDTVA